MTFWDHICTSSFLIYTSQLTTPVWQGGIHNKLFKTSNAKMQKRQRMQVPCEFLQLPPTRFSAKRFHLLRGETAGGGGNGGRCVSPFGVHLNSSITQRYSVAKPVPSNRQPKPAIYMQNIFKMVQSSSPLIMEHGGKLVGTGRVSTANPQLGWMRSPLRVLYTSAKNHLDFLRPRAISGVYSIGSLYSIVYGGA